MAKMLEMAKMAVMEKTDENSGHYVIASSQPPKRRPLERRTLAPISRITIGQTQQ